MVPHRPGFDHDHRQLSQLEHEANNLLSLSHQSLKKPSHIDRLFSPFPGSGFDIDSNDSGSNSKKTSPAQLK
jgi:hypothetical protein